jgi:phosphohistidine phosphatase SixA
MPRMKRRDALILTLPWLGATPLPLAAAADDDTRLASRLREGRVAVLLRHAATDPGIGDPPGFRPGVCATQRNLSADGRAQARRIGAWFKSRGLVPGQVRSSAWCRCLDTGTLAFGRAEAWPALNSFFGEASARDQQSAVLAAGLGEIGAQRFEVWITHQINITALTNEYAEMGEGCVVGPAGAAGSRVVPVVGRSRFGA